MDSTGVLFYLLTKQEYFMNKVIVTGLVALALVGCGKKEEVVVEAVPAPAPVAEAPAVPPVEAAPAPAAGGVVVKEEGKQALK
jgi:hypothetical protein